jgi:hypothetical protein
MFLEMLKIMKIYVENQYIHTHTHTHQYSRKQYEENSKKKTVRGVVIPENDLLIGSQVSSLYTDFVK